VGWGEREVLMCNIGCIGYLISGDRFESKLKHSIRGLFRIYVEGRSVGWGEREMGCWCMYRVYRVSNQWRWIEEACLC